MSEEVNPIVPGEVPAAPAAPVAPAPNTPEYNQMMAARGTAATATDSIPEKFLNADGTVNMDAFSKSYAELEKQFHTPADGAAPEAAPEVAPEAEVPAEPVAPELDKLQIAEPEVAAEVEATPEAKPQVTEEKWVAWKQEVMRTGDVSAESRVELEAMGFNDAIIKDFVSAHKSQLKAGMAKAAAVVGGDDSLSKIFGWAGNNLDVGAREQINAGLSGPAWEVTLRGLEAQYNAAQQGKPKAAEMTHKASAANPAGKETQRGYASLSEFSAQRADAKYGRDVRYTEQVNTRAGMTDWTQIR